MRSQRSGLGSHVALSLGAHGLFALGLWTTPEPSRPPRVAPTPMRVEVQVVPIAPVPPAPVPPAPVAEPTPPEPVARPRSRPRSRPTPTPSPPLAPAPPSDTPPETARERRTRLRRAAVGARRAAELSVLADDPGPVMPSDGAGLAPVASVTILSEAEAEARHDGHLAERAAERSWIVDTAIDLEGPHPDGSYTWRSSSFTATISAEGVVSFSDRGALEFDLAHGEATFDLTDMIMGAAGADPYAYERDRFYEENRELIEELDAVARVASLRHSGEGIRRRLIRAWEGGGSARARRASLFEEWDLCGETDIERPARDMVLAFIRAELPEGSRWAYPESELEALNERRLSAEPFAPYAP
jgi:hypothetical protein